MPELWRRWSGKGKEMNRITRTDLEHMIEEYLIGRNAERNRKIVKRRLIDGICFEPLAEEFGMSVRQVKNIVYNAEMQIFGQKP